MCRRDASLGRGEGGVFGSRHRFTGEEFYRRHFVALRFHAVNVAASRRVFARVCTDSKKRLFHVAHDGDPCRRGNAEYRREVQPLFSKLLLAGFAILRAPSFLSQLHRICYSTDDEINILYPVYIYIYIKGEEIFPRSIVY